MKTIRKVVGEQTLFILADLDPIYHDAARNLYFVEMEDGFAKTLPSDTPHLEQIFQNFKRYAEEMVLQMAGVHPVPWEQALSSLLQIIEPYNIDWWLGGSAALAVRGLVVVPHDFDLIVAEVDAQKLGEVLLDYLIEPVVPVENWIGRWFGRAFLHARVEWVAGIEDWVDKPDVTDFGPMAASHLETVSWRGHDIRVPLLDLQLAVCERRGLTERVEKIKLALTGKKYN